MSGSQARFKFMVSRAVVDLPEPGLPILRQLENALGDDVALDLRRAGGDGQRDGVKALVHRGNSRRHSRAASAEKRLRVGGVDRRSTRRPSALPR